MDEEKVIQDNSNEDGFNDTLTGKMRENPWVVATVALGLLSIVLLIGNLSNPTGSVITGGVVGINSITDSLEQFTDIQTQGQGILLEVNDYNDYLYEAIIDFQDQEIPVYVTKDAEYLVQGLIPLDQLINIPEIEETTTEIPKSDKPINNLYIWSYCPYGVTALAPFSQVAKLLENYAEFNVVLYYAGHGDFEVQQNKIQACIQELEIENYWDYAQSFAETIYEKCYGDADCDLDESVALMNSLNIDSDKVLDCVNEKGEQLLEEHFNKAKELGVTGSPTLLINDIASTASRTAEAYKNDICSAFNNAPEECSETLSSTGTTASGNC